MMVAAAAAAQNRVVHLEPSILLLVVVQVLLGTKHGELLVTGQEAGRPPDALEVPLIPVLVKDKGVEVLTVVVAEVVVDNTAAAAAVQSQVLPVAVVAAM